MILKARFEDGRLAAYETFPVTLVNHRPQLSGPGQWVDVRTGARTGTLTGGG
jgi:hypothetical protein